MGVQAPPRFGRQRLLMATTNASLAGTQLTEREAEVASLAAAGNTNTRIAQRLNLTTSTIEQRLTSIYKKLGCRRPGLAAALAALTQET